MSSFQFEQIGVIRSPYKEKFAVPRQPGLVKSANGELHLIAPYNQADAVRGLEAFSHLWILFVFHQTMEGGWRPTVRPPRLGGNARMGVFATRSTFRPNPIGMSLVELKEVVCHKDSVILKLGSLDLVMVRRWWISNLISPLPNRFQMPVPAMRKVRQRQRWR